MPEPSAHRTACGYYLCCPLSFSHILFGLPKASSLPVRQVSSTDWSNPHLGSEVLGPLVQLLRAMKSSIPMGIPGRLGAAMPWASPVQLWGNGKGLLSSPEIVCSISAEWRNQQTSIVSAQIKAPCLTKQIVPMGTPQDAAAEEKLSRKKPFSRVKQATVAHKNTPTLSWLVK